MPSKLILTLFEERSLPRYWYLEDVIYPGHTVIAMSSSSVFFAAIRDLFGLTESETHDIGSPILRRQVSIFKNSSGTILLADLKFEQANWNRDPPLRTMQGYFLYACPRNRSSLQKDTRNFQHQDDAKYHFILTEVSKVIAPYRMPTNQFLWSLIVNRKFGFHTLPMAGGNIFCARRNQGDTDIVFVVGKAVVTCLAEMLSEEDTLKAQELEPQLFKAENIQSRRVKHFGSQTFGQKDTYDQFETKFEKRILAAKIMIRHFVLGSELASSESAKPKNERHCIFVNQYLYHIDCLLLYIGFGVFVIHDFRATVEFLRELISQRIRFSVSESENDAYLNAIERLIENNLKLQASYQGVVADIYRQLTQAGLTCVCIPGMLIPGDITSMGFAESSLEPSHTKHPISILHFIDNIAFSLMNGIPIAPKIFYGPDQTTIQKMDFQILVPGPREENIFFNHLCGYVSNKIAEVLARQFHISQSDISVIFQPVYATTIDGTVTESTPFPLKSRSAATVDGAGQPPSFSVFQFGGAPSTSRWMLQKAGGLRCQSNLFSKPVAIQALSSFATDNFKSDGDFVGLNMAPMLWGVPKPEEDKMNKYAYQFFDLKYTFDMQYYRMVEGFPSTLFSPSSSVWPSAPSSSALPSGTRPSAPSSSVPPSGPPSGPPSYASPFSAWPSWQSSSTLTCDPIPPTWDGGR